MQITWALAVRRQNTTFPAKSILKAHEICSYYFPVTFVQVAKNPQLWYYLSDQAANGAYMFTRFSGLRGIHIPASVNYGLNMEACQMAIRHEIGHWLIGKSGHNNDPNSLMAAQPRISTMWTPNDWNYWFKSWGSPKPGTNPWDREEFYRWFPRPKATYSEPLIRMGCDHEHKTTWSEYLISLAPRKVVTVD